MSQVTTPTPPPPTPLTADLLVSAFSIAGVTGDNANAEIAAILQLLAAFSSLGLSPTQAQAFITQQATIWKAQQTALKNQLTAQQTNIANQLAALSV